MRFNTLLLQFCKSWNFDRQPQIQNSAHDKSKLWNWLNSSKNFKRTVSLAFVITSISGYFIIPPTVASNSLVLTKAVPSNLRSSFDQVIDKFYDLNSRVESGINYQSYSNEVSNLKVAFDRLGRKPGAKNFDSYKHLGAALMNYKDAKELWQLCMEDSDCTNQILNTSSPYGTYLVKKYRIVTIGKKPGATSDDKKYFLNRIHLSEGLTKIWGIASGHITKAQEKI